MEKDVFTKTCNGLEIGQYNKIKLKENINDTSISYGK